MPLSALFLLMMGAGGFLLYTAIKGAKGPAGGHPVTAFKDAINGASLSQGSGTPNKVAGVNGAAVQNALTSSADNVAGTDTYRSGNANTVGAG